MDDYLFVCLMPFSYCSFACFLSLSSWSQATAQSHYLSSTVMATVFFIFYHTCSYKRQYIYLGGSEALHAYVHLWGKMRTCRTKIVWLSPFFQKEKLRKKRYPTIHPISSVPDGSMPSDISRRWYNQTLVFQCHFPDHPGLAQSPRRANMHEMQDSRFGLAYQAWP